jgi:hypothetical protein
VIMEAENEQGALKTLQDHDQWGEKVIIETLRERGVLLRDFLLLASMSLF